ncbi:MAG: RyR domain-containing protein [Alistipes sp.]|nr:RyR domain-containing protein [Alistipes sp.]
MKKRSINNISAEVLAAFLDGNATAQESNEIIGALSEDARLRELLDISQAVDADMGLILQDSDLLPMTAMAATCDEENYCSLECEKYVLRRLNIEFDELQLLENAIYNGWQRQDGTALHNVGRHLEANGLVVTRRYKSSISDIAQALYEGDNVIVAVDGGELIGNGVEELLEDILISQIPDHVVVVLSLDTENKTITIFDPNSSNQEDTYALEQFEDAWNDSKNYMLTITSNTMKTYIPQPIDLTDVELAEELYELREAIAENAHDVWAAERQAQGWTYGPQRDDQKKETPCMVAYSQLPDSEKKFDREMAMNTLKLLSKLGYDIVKREK